MSDLDTTDTLVDAWLEPLADASAPCGADLEYDNDFLALNQAAAGKPESQFGPAEAPDWRAVVGSAELLFGRTRDLRIAVLWLRGMLHTQGYGALAPGLRLLSGLVRTHWDHVHPLPDPDDGDPYGRVNALTLLRESAGLIGDLRETRIVADRGIGEITGRAIEVALGLSPLRDGETDVGKGPIEQMLAAALIRNPALRAQVSQATAAVQDLVGLLDDKLDSQAPDLKPLQLIVRGVEACLPRLAELAEEATEGGPDGAPAGASGGASSRGLSGTVSSREEAIRAIDMVCEYLERAEPTNPAPLFLRRARQLINHNFLQLMKALAPDALSEVARAVGIDPDSIEAPTDP